MSKRSGRRYPAWFAVGGLIVALGCGENASPPPSGAAGSATGGSGGVAPTGGTGGVVPTGGTGGIGTTGGSGGVIPTGGSGGIVSTGGSGGVVPTGGTGGILATGGTGGVIPTGGSGGIVPTGGAGGGTLTPEARAVLENLKPRLAALSAETSQWWLDHGLDATYGGFCGTLDAQGNQVGPTDKGLIQEARHLWAFSMWYERRSPTPNVQAAADSTYQFIVSHLRDPSDGEFFYKVNQTGTSVVDSRKNFYAVGFAIYALSEYARVFGVTQARDYALAGFQHLDGRAHDAVNGGYDQRTDPGWMSSGAQKEMNTHIHLMEAWTALYELTHDAVVGARLSELVDVTIDHMLQPSGYQALEYLLDWTPYGTPTISYGHDLETTWLLLESARAVGRDTEPKVVNAALTMGRNAALAGYNATTGAYNYDGTPGGAVGNTEHVWWVEFEALSGLLWLYRLGGEQVQLDRMQSTLAWLEARHDATYGEWYWGHWPDGSMGPRGTNKGEEWKASYHDLRSLVYNEDWIDELLQ